MPRKAKPFAATPEITEAVRMYRDGATGKQVSQYLGVSAFTAVRMLRKAGVEIRPRGCRVNHTPSPTPQPPAPPAHAHPQQISPYDTYPPVTLEYIKALSDRWSRKIPGIVKNALEESRQPPPQQRENRPDAEKDA